LNEEAKFRIQEAIRVESRLAFQTAILPAFHPAALRVDPAEHQEGHQAAAFPVASRWNILAVRVWI